MSRRAEAMQAQTVPRVLILTPVKDAIKHLPGYVDRLEALTYPRQALSLGILEGDSRDATWDMLSQMQPRLEETCGRLALVRKHFGFQMPPGVPRWERAYQLTRRTVLARARNHLMFRALDDEDWVLWLDVDVIQYPPDLIEQLLAADRDIVHPHCVTRPGGPTFDRNGWREQGEKFLSDFRGGGPVRLDAVGGTALLVRADIHRDGLIFPPFRFGVESSAARQVHPVWGRGEVETEGLGIMALEMGCQSWGLPDLEIIHASE